MHYDIEAKIESDYVEVSRYLITKCRGNIIEAIKVAEDSLHYARIEGQQYRGRLMKRVLEHLAQES